MNEKQLALVNKLTDLAQQAAEAIADYTETEKDDTIVTQLNPFVDMIQQYLLRMKG
jgi:hypothetical protein